MEVIKEAVRSGDSEAKTQWLALIGVKRDVENQALSPNAMRRILANADSRE